MRISKSDIGASSKITRKINVKPENRKTVFGFNIQTTTQREGNWQEQKASTPELENFSKLASHTGLKMWAGGGSVSRALISERLGCLLPAGEH